MTPTAADPAQTPAADRLYVLSDLHLAPAGEQCVFNAHAPLVALVNHLRTQPKSWLILNGDVFDFLQIPGYNELSLPLAAQRMQQILDDLDNEPPERNLVQALRHFTAAGHRLSCLPGNHDPELNLASVQEVLAARLGAETQALPPSQGYWRMQVAGRRVVGLHGHHIDAFNAIASQSLLQAQADGRESLPLPPGSRLVCEVTNTYRRARTADGARRFPFVDAMPSETAAALALLILDPAKAGRALATTLGLKSHSLVRAVLRRSGVASAHLSARAPVAATANAETSAETNPFEASLAQALADALSPADRAAETRVADELQSWLDGRAAPAAMHRPVRQPDRQTTGAAAMLSAGSLVRGLLLRALGRCLDDARLASPIDQPDALARDVISTWGRGVVALTGHTHAPKRIADDQSGVYLNNGSWLDQVAGPATTDADAVDDWLQRLQRGALPWQPQRPVVRVDAEGAALLRWDGVKLVD